MMNQEGFEIDLITEDPKQESMDSFQKACHGTLTCDDVDCEDLDTCYKAWKKKGGKLNV